MDLRQQTKDYILKYGSRQSFFADKLGVSKTHFHLWLVGQRDMAECRLQALRKILAE